MAPERGTTRAAGSPKPQIITVRRRRRHPVLWLIVLLVVAVWLVALCSPSNNRSGTGTTSSVATTTQAAPSTNARPAPSDDQVQQAFQAYITERADSGVMLAQLVTSVTAINGIVTVTLDPDPGVVASSPFDNLAELFGVPVAFNDEDGVWLRRNVQRVDVVDTSGGSLGSMTAAELNRMGVG